MKSWQCKWDEDKTGRCTYEFIIVVGEQGSCGRENATSKFHMAECYYMIRCWRM